MSTMPESTNQNPFSSAVDSRAKTSVQPTSTEQGCKEPNQVSGDSFIEFCKNSDPQPSSLKTSRARERKSGSRLSEANLRNLGIESAPWGLAPETLALPTPVPESLLLATPTATANQLAPSMRKWPSCRRLQDLFGMGGLPPPRGYEWLMGFPEGWTLPE